MRVPPWLRGPRALEAAGFALLVVFLSTAFALGWHRAIPGLSETASEDVVVGSGHRPVESPLHNEDPLGEGGHHPGDHAGVEAIELSEQARRNLNLETDVLALESFVRRISLPATMVDWPGRTHVNIAAPLTGSVTSLHVTRGETVTSGAALYTLRLTHQDLVQTQTEFLQLLGRADVEQREIERLSELAESGAIARKSLLERQYEWDKLQASIRAERESLLLHGLSESQIAEIERSRRLIREVTVYAPILHDDRSLHADETGDAAPLPPIHASDPESTLQSQAPGHREHIEAQFVVTELAARRGQSVATGDPLVVLADYQFLLAEGRAFQQDAEALATAARNDWPVQAVIDRGDEPRLVIDGLTIAYVGGEIDEATRALPFYVPLDNEIVQEEQRGEHRYVTWRFKPGQRLRLRVPVEQVADVFVLPVSAVASEGPDRYVFVENGDHFERRPVEVAMRDQLSVAIANDGSLLPGETVALNGAHQLQMALKNRAGGPIDAHAGHTH